MDENLKWINKKIVLTVQIYQYNMNFIMYK